MAAITGRWTAKSQFGYRVGGGTTGSIPPSGYPFNSAPRPIYEGVSRLAHTVSGNIEVIIGDKRYSATGLKTTIDGYGSITIEIEDMRPVVEQDQFEQSREFGREFARTCKKLNAMSVAIGQGFNDEMERQGE